MHLPEQLYTWLVESGILNNQGQIDDKGNVTLPAQQISAIDNGFTVGEAIKFVMNNQGKKTPSSLANVKPDSSKNAKLTNWSFIWLAFEAVGMKHDTRIKQLILQGEQALIVEILMQLYDRDPNKKQNAKISIKTKVSSRPKAGGSQAVDVKKINLNKDPQQSESSLEYLIVLLKASLGMTLQQILGLFTNQNKYLAQVIVKGINDKFDPIVLFYTLLNKHALKLKNFHEQDSRDAQSCLYAIKPGFISKDEKVAELTLELFGKLNRIYEWFVSEDSKCAGTFLLGIKRHPALREQYWKLLLQIIEGEELQFFTKHYAASFQSSAEQIEITTYLLKYIVSSPLGQKIATIGIASTWLETTTNLPETDIEAQIAAFDFMGELMIYMPEVIEQNEESLVVLTRNWENRNLGQFVVLFNQLILLLQKLGEGKSPMAKRIYGVVSEVARNVKSGDKRDYLVQNFLPLISKFPTIPSEHLIAHLKRSPLSTAEYLLICQTIDISQDVQTLVSIGSLLKTLLIENPLVNFYVINLLKTVVQRLLADTDSDSTFIQSLLEDSLHAYAVTEIKYKSRIKQQKSLYFGKSGSPEKISKEQSQETTIKQKWKQLFLVLTVQLTDVACSQENETIKALIKQKIMKANSYLKMNNHKVGSKKLEDLLTKRFDVSKEQQIQFSEEYKQKAQANLEQSMVRKSKVQSHVTLLSTKIKAPESMAKQFQLIIEKRKHQEEMRKALDIKKNIIEDKKKLSVKKELEITNLLRGQIGEAQIREEGFLEKLMPEGKQLRLIPMDQLQNRQFEAIQSLLKKYHRVLRHLFLIYTGTMYSNHTAEAIEDNQRRKEILTCVELGKMLKDYRMFYLTSQPEINAMIRDINVKLLNRREVNELDFKGFQQYVIQFCFMKMVLPHEISVLGSDGSYQRIVKNLSGQPIFILLKEFFMELKQSFISRREKVFVFEDIQDVPLSKEQLYEVNILNQKLNQNHQYILPKGYKKIVEINIEFQYAISSQISGLPEKYEIAYDALDFILSQLPLNIHIMESVAQKKVSYKVRPTTFGFPGEIPRERAMSTVIDRKTPFLMEMQGFVQLRSKRGSSKGTIHLKLQNEDVSETEDKVEKKSQELKKEVVKPKKSISVARLAEMEKARFQAMAKKARDKQEQKERELKKERDVQRRRRIQTEKFLQQQKAKFAQKRQKAEQQRQSRLKEESQKQIHKKDNKEKFKQFHQNQLQRIKKIELQALEKIKRDKEKEQEDKQKYEEQRQRLREKIKEEDERIVQTRKDIERKLTNLFESEPIKSTFQRYEPNLKAIFDFLIQRTHLSLTEKKHNNEIIYDTWRYFLTAFELSPLIVHVKDVVFIFKSITRDKIVPKEYLVGLSYKQFQEALLHLGIRYKTIFNHISERIKDKIEQKPPAKEENEVDKSKKGGKKGAKEVKTKPVEPEIKMENEFESSGEINIKQMMKQNNQGKDDIDQYGDLSKVNGQTLRGLIYYLKVPATKAAQEERFRAIMAEKPKGSVNNAERLKQKLNEEYTLEPSPKKAPQQKASLQASMQPQVPTSSHR